MAAIPAGTPLLAAVRRARVDAGRAQSYVEELDDMLGRLGAGVPLVDDPIRAPERLTTLDPPG